MVFGVNTEEVIVVVEVDMEGLVLVVLGVTMKGLLIVASGVDVIGLVLMPSELGMTTGLIVEGLVTTMELIVI